TTQDTEKFATYHRDATNLDYADQRYYTSTWGRFLTPDPYDGSASLTKPQSWNRYVYVGNDPINFNDPEGLDIEIPITYGAYECTSRVYDEILGRAGYGRDANALTNFARSDWGRMGLAMWGEVRPDTASDAAMNTALMGVGFTFINRYNLRGTITDFGHQSDSLARVVIIASDIWNNDGDMLASAKTGLTGVLKDNSKSGDCDGLIQSIKIAGSIMAQTVGFSGGGIGALPNVYNPVGSAVYFRSSDVQPGAAYGYSTHHITTLRWTGWGPKQRNRRKFLSFWGIAPLRAGGPLEPEPDPTSPLPELPIVY
ncbi:MAG: RHS repeat-associated core domain-containing protein, partial [Planctomycetota bacterium]